MELYDNLLKDLTDKYEITTYIEDFENVKVIAKSDYLKSIDKEILENFIKGIWKNDRVRIKIFEDEYQIAAYSTGNALDDFICGLKEDISDDDESYVISIEIIKVNVENIVSIYDFKKVTEYLKGLSLKGILYEFNKLLKNGELKLITLYDEIECASDSIYIGKKLKIDNKFMDIREYRITKRKEICNFINSSEYLLCGDDFNFVECVNKDFKLLMDKLKCILSLISICDISNIKSDNELEVTLNGYKRINSTINYNNFYDSNLEEYYGICTWIYEEGDMNDRVGIVRNIISLSIGNGDISNMVDSMEASVRSAHEIYLKENVTQYLDVKEKIAEFLFDLTKKTSELADNVGKGFYNNMVALITFYGSLIIMNALNENKLSNIFTKDITVLSLVFWAGGIVYMILSQKETDEEIDRYKKLYYRVKNSYNDILNEKDIDRIFKKDIYLKEDEEYIRNRSQRYVICWKILLAGMLAVVLILGKNSIVSFIDKIL